MNGPTKNQTGISYARQALLPEGFRDQLAPKAEFEAALVRGLMDTFTSHGYDRVAPPVVEYEDSLLVGAGATRGEQMFRLMDPDTQRMMAVRADMTIQMSRLAATRLSESERPLRLSYTGNVLRTKGSQIRPTRQFVQAGIELIGSASLEAEFEVIAVAVEALTNAGVQSLSLDFTVAPLVQMLCEQHKLSDSDCALAFEALDAKDSGALDSLPNNARQQFDVLLASAGHAKTAIEGLRSLELKGAAGQLVARLGRLIAMVESELSNIQITVDPCESYGFEYKSGIGFSLFAKGSQSELGRGGRYLVNHANGTNEEATGFSVYLDSVMAAVKMPVTAKRLFLPKGSDRAVCEQYRRDGWRTIQGLTDAADPANEAQRLGCSHMLVNGEIIAL